MVKWNLGHFASDNRYFVKVNSNIVLFRVFFLQNAIYALITIEVYDIGE